MPKESLNNPQFGMKFLHPSLLQEGMYSLLVNGNVGTLLGDFNKLSSEPSNILCSRFKQGYKVIGILPAISLNISFFFLTNTTTGENEIGIINHSFREDSQDTQVNCPTCLKKLTPNSKTPKECTYTTFVNANCLNFSYDFPITSWLKVDDCNVRIYFTDDFNDPRYIDYTDFPKQELSNCPKVTNEDLDCEKVKIFKDACSPFITAIDVVSGGQNTAGVYQFAIAYSDAYGNPITNYFYIPNKVDLWDRSKTIISNENTAYPVSKSIKIQIEGINSNFDWFNLVVLKTINGATTAHLVETFSNTGATFTYTYSGIDKNVTRPITLDEVLRKTPIYNRAKGVEDANGINLMWNLSEPRILNLQPFVNTLPVLWETVELNEGDYVNPILAYKYQTYLRDEVYPLSIEFSFTNTNKTARFHIPGRESTSFDLENVVLIDGQPNPDVFSSNACENASGYVPRWQVYNTASVSGYACNYDPDDEECPNEISVDFSCQKPIFYSQNPSGGYFLDYDENTNTLSNPVVDPCSYFDCETPSGDCLSEIESLYPSYTSITPTGCSINVITPGGEFTVNVYNPSGYITTTPARPSSYPSPPTNIECESYIYSITDCNNQIAVALQNEGGGTQTLWYYFSALSDAQAVTIQSIYNQTDGNTFTIDLYKSSDGFCTGIGSPVETITQSSPYFLFEDLESGGAYFFSVTGNTNVTAGVNDYYYICTDAPEPIGTTTEFRPDVVAVTCRYSITYCVKYDVCNAKIFNYGKMAYWESTDLYPCNREVWGDLANTPIRHHKFPDCLISPHYRNLNTGLLGKEDLYKVKNKIYPIGLRIDIEDIKNLLLEAEQAGNITTAERLSICSYRIYRGNRRGNESIIAKGHLHDVWQYKDNVYKTNNFTLYPNYPYNSRQDDVFNLETKLEQENSPLNPIEHPYKSQNYQNNKYTFLGANTLFNNPGLGTELKLEMEQYGISEGRYTEVINHPKYQYIGIGAVQAAYGFAALESMFDAIGEVNAGGLLSAAVLSPFASMIWGSKVPNHFYDWLDIIRKLAPFKNFAWYYTSIGNYTDFIPATNPSGGVNPDNTIVEGNVRRFINDAQYLKQGIYTVGSGAERLKFNNYKREGSVYVNIDDSVAKFDATFIADNSRWYPGDGSIDGGSCSNAKLGYVYRDISSYYASLKNNLPNQYGQVDQIEYVDTGQYNSLDWYSDQNTVCTPIFGGDSFINRFSLRTQLPFFLYDTVGQAPNTDVQYNEIGNIGYPHFFFNYPTGAELPRTGAGRINITQLFGDVAVVNNSRYDYSFNCENNTGDIWLLGAVGALGLTNSLASGNIVAGIGVVITNATVVATFNLSDPKVYLNGKFFLYSYGEPSFITESDYNLDLRYGTNQKEGNFYPNIADMVTWTQPTAQFNMINFDNTYNYNNDYSKQNKENLGYILNPDFSQSKEDCKVEHPNRVVYSIQDNDNNDRFDGNLVFLANNFYDFPKAAGKLVLLKAIENNKVLVLQENQATVFNAYNTLEADIKAVVVGAGVLFSQQLQQFIKTDLGFAGSQTSANVLTEFGVFWADNKRGDIFQLQGSINQIVQESESQWFKENLPFKITNYFSDVDINNPFKGIGMNIWWDKRFKRVFFSKKDYIPREEYRKDITFLNNTFYYNDIIIELTNTKYFCDNSWTIAYSPILKNFISFYTFIPDYVNSLADYFQTGINTEDTSIWNHNLTNQSFQTFYGEEHPFILEVATKDTFNNKLLNSVSYQHEWRRYTDNYLNYALNNKITFNKAIVYNNFQTTGNLNLIPQIPNNLFQLTQYPKITGNSTDILVANTENIWHFNGFKDIAVESQPIMVYDCNPSYKEVNPNGVSYTPKHYSEQLRNDWFTLRLINDKEFKHQVIIKPIVNQTTKSSI